MEFRNSILACKLPIIKILFKVYGAGQYNFRIILGVVSNFMKKK